MAIATKRRLGQRRCWRLPSCINYQDVRTSVECVADGAWGSLSGSACLIYLIQRYSFMGTPRVSIYLFSSATWMNSLTKLCHQVDAELDANNRDESENRKNNSSVRQSNLSVIMLQTEQHTGPVYISHCVENIGNLPP